MRSLRRASSIWSMRPLNAGTLFSTPRARSRIDSICSALARSLGRQLRAHAHVEIVQAAQDVVVLAAQLLRQLHVGVVDADRHLGVVEILAHLIGRVALALDLGDGAVELLLRARLLLRRQRLLHLVLVELARRHRGGAQAVELRLQLDDALVELVELPARLLPARLHRVGVDRQRAQLRPRARRAPVEPLELLLGAADVADELGHLAGQRLLDHRDLVGHRDRLLARVGQLGEDVDARRPGHRLVEPADDLVRLVERLAQIALVADERRDALHALVALHPLVRHRRQDVGEVELGQVLRDQRRGSRAARCPPS